MLRHEGCLPFDAFRTRMFVADCHPSRTHHHPLHCVVCRRPQRPAKQKCKVYSELAVEMVWRSHKHFIPQFASQQRSLLSLRFSILIPLMARSNQKPRTKRRVLEYSVWTFMRSMDRVNRIYLQSEQLTDLWCVMHLTPPVYRSFQFI